MQKWDYVTLTFSSSWIFWSCFSQQTWQGRRAGVSNEMKDVLMPVSCFTSSVLLLCLLQWKSQNVRFIKSSDIISVTSVFITTSTRTFYWINTFKCNYKNSSHCWWKKKVFFLNMGLLLLAESTFTQSTDKHIWSVLLQSPSAASRSEKQPAARFTEADL